MCRAGRGLEEVRIQLLQVKVAPRFELGIRALQAPALPLGHATIKSLLLKIDPTPLTISHKRLHQVPRFLQTSFSIQNSRVSQG